MALQVERVLSRKQFFMPLKPQHQVSRPYAHPAIYIENANNGGIKMIPFLSIPRCAERRSEQQSMVTDCNTVNRSHKNLRCFKCFQPTMLTGGVDN